jgi:hypothetical protein
MSVIPLRKPEAVKLFCSACLASVDAACDCGVSYVKAGTLAERAVEANPEKSDRAIAAEIGVSAPTVSKARRESTVNNFTVEKRIGRDGKVRKLPAKKTDPKPATRFEKIKAKHKQQLERLCSAWEAAGQTVREEFLDQIGVRGETS